MKEEAPIVNTSNMAGLGNDPPVKKRKTFKEFIRDEKLFSPKTVDKE